MCSSVCLSCMLILRSVLSVVQIFHEIDLGTRLSLQPIHFHQANKQTKNWLPWWRYIFISSIVYTSIYELFFDIRMRIWDGRWQCRANLGASFAAPSYRLYFGYWVMSRLFPQLSSGSTTGQWPQSHVTQNLSNTLLFMKVINSLMPIFSLTQTSNIPWLCLNHLLKLRKI